MIHKLDTTLTTTLWSKAIPAVGNVPVNSITRLHLNSTIGVLLVTTPTAIELRSAHDGSLVARRELVQGETATNYRQATWGPGGSVYALSSTAFEQLGADLLPTTTPYAVTGGVGFSVTPSGILLTHASTTRRLDPLTLQDQGVVRTHAAEARLTTTGDATGDGQADHVVALADLTVVVFDGLLGAHASSHAPELVNAGQVGVEIPQWEPPRKIDDSGKIKPPGGGATADCPDSEKAATYQKGRACLNVVDEKKIRSEPLQLQAEGGRVLFTYERGTAPYVFAVRSDGTVIMDTTLMYGHTPTSIWLGPWNIGSRAFVIADNSGFVTLRDEATKLVTWSVVPSKFVGQFTFNMRIPEGGTFGTHLLVTKLMWTLPDGQTRTAQLVDWFEVVSAEGKPVANPLYMIKIRLLDPFDPPRTGRG